MSIVLGLRSNLHQADTYISVVTVATFLQTLIHPGWFFPALGTYRERKKMNKASRESSSSGISAEEEMAEDRVKTGEMVKNVAN